MNTIEVLGEGHSAPVFRRHSLYHREFQGGEARAVSVERIFEIPNGGAGKRILTLEWVGKDTKPDRVSYQVTYKNRRRLAEAAEALESGNKSIMKSQIALSDYTTVDMDGTSALTFEVKIAEDGTRNWGLRGPSDVLFEFGDKENLLNLVNKVAGK